MMLEQERTVVLGLGNPWMSDDGAGLAAAQEVARLLEEHPVAGVQVRLSTRGGFELLDLLSGCTRVILIDCLVVMDGTPGRVRRLTLNDVASLPRLGSAHEAGLADVFRLAERAGIPMPESVEVFAVEAGDAETVSENMTPPVRAAVTRIAVEIHALLLHAAASRQAPSPRAPE
jgi:hydrogenase maturation protease